VATPLYLVNGEITAIAGQSGGGTGVAAPLGSLAVALGLVSIDLAYRFLVLDEFTVETAGELDISGEVVIL